MAKNNYYAVKSGKQKGIFDNWADCSKQVQGVKGAVYRGFKNLSDAKEYYNGQDVEQSTMFESQDEIMEILEDNQAIAYVDGSNLGDGSAFSWGIVMFSKKFDKVEINGKSTDPEISKFRNVAGELFASVNAIKWAIKKGMDKIIIYHDYSGIRHYALNEWKLNNILTKDYNKFFQKAKDKIEIKFVKAEGHTNDKFNEEADLLAKQALGIKK